MVNDKWIIEQDLKHVWHPCSQMKSFEQNPPLIVHQAKGSYLYTDRGPIIDAISSWWCKSLGHGHPKVIEAIQDQLLHFEHVITANTTTPHIVELARMLKSISGKQHVFFASDGSSAVEIALKLALHATKLKGYHSRKRFISLKNSYHGETLGTLNVSDCSTYNAPFDLGLGHYHLQSIPYVNTTHDPLWDNCEPVWHQTIQELESIKQDVCAVIVEPIVQGAAGMRCYSADFLKRLAIWAKANDIYLIADEIMTGLGRTGQWLASHHANIEPDLICLSKGLTSGSIPFSCVLIDAPIFDLFYDNDGSDAQSFLHSHTYSGNPLGVRAALATLTFMQEENINQHAQALGDLMRQYFFDIAVKTQKLDNVRSIGALVAADLPTGLEKLAPKVHQEALARGALLRPIGRTIYWLPPLTTSTQTIEQLAEITLKSIDAVFS